MRKLLFPFLLFATLGVQAQAENPKYDKTLAESLGGDDYGMKSYVLAMLKTGSNTTADKETTAALYRGHLDNIGRLADMGKLVVAGPMGKNDKSYRGLFILNVKTIAEATELLQTDPAIKEKLLQAGTPGTDRRRCPNI